MGVAPPKRPRKGEGAMDQQTIEAQLTHEGARELLASTAAAHLAYVAKDGTPESRPGRLLLDRGGVRGVHGDQLAEARIAVRAT